MKDFYSQKMKMLFDEVLVEHYFKPYQVYFENEISSRSKLAAARESQVGIVSAVFISSIWNIGDNKNRGCAGDLLVNSAT